MRGKIVVDPMELRGPLPAAGMMANAALPILVFLVLRRTAAAPARRA